MASYPPGYYFYPGYDATQEKEAKESTPSRTDRKPVTTPKTPKKHVKTSNPLSASGVLGGTGISHIGGGSKKKKDVTTTIKHHNAANLSKSVDIATDHGLADKDILRSVRVDQRSNLLRNPVEKNMPRVTVDSSLFKDLIEANKPQVEEIEEQEQEEFEQTEDQLDVDNDNDTAKIKAKTKQDKQTKKADEVPLDPSMYPVYLPNGEIYQPPQTIASRQSKSKKDIDDYWKKEILIDNNTGEVAIEPIDYDDDTYDGPFGMARRGSYIYYSVLVILAMLAVAIILLILIGVWHQKRMKEKPRPPPRTIMKHRESIVAPPYSSNTYEPALPPIGGPSYQEYGVIPAPQQQYIPPSSYQVDYFGQPMTNEDLLQQNGFAATAYEPVLWTSSVDYHPVQQTTEWPSQRRTEQRFDNLFPNSVVTEEPLPVLKKAPETSETMRMLARHRPYSPIRRSQSQATPSTNNRVKPTDSHHRERRHKAQDLQEDFSMISNDNHSYRNHHHRHHGHHHHSEHPRHHTHTHHHHRHWRRSSPSIVSYNSETKLIDPPRIISTQTSAKPPPSRTVVVKDAGTGTMLETKIMKDSGVTADFEDVQNVKPDQSLENLPVFRRTIIVEPYPAQPTAQILVKPRTDMIGKIRLSKNSKQSTMHIVNSVDADQNEAVVWSTDSLPNQNQETPKLKKKKRKSITNTTANNEKPSLQSNSIPKFKSTMKPKPSAKKRIKNAFY
ncbi:unnamed protein product [Didymodactylos carnosus]|uniref:Uncharacterized protein n=1 Tax=Didymodactylos carnosus TaxID=1234261 RepID=A0A814CGF5_9BILA|nr:unnamed protein product [Didymodactylos carnosus]CAF1014978.1 unnamed protein product [Didymodactylos carnosus]CAF3719333.1 unnamed protein product [Didymodactylos carnosus]CAF3784056.1 unnamed protein product [Didymodactylos carnosus]